MIKKDRIAVVISIIWVVILLPEFLPLNTKELLLIVLPLLGYWGYRFIKIDISFINKSENNDQ